MTGIATGQVVHFQVRADADDVAGLYTAIEVHRSRMALEGPYEEITGSSWGSATFTVQAKALFLNGLQLKLRLKEETDITITFSGSNPISASDIADQIHAQGLGLVDGYIEDDNLVIASMQPGAAITLRALESDGATLLGLSTVEPTSVAFGHDARIPIQSTVESYPFIDYQGSTAYYYRTRFRNSSTNVVSGFSIPFTANDVEALDDSDLIIGYVQLVELNGVPKSDVEVIIQNKGPSTLINGKLVSGIASIRTNSSGKASFTLVRGSNITVAITGLSIVRDVEVPTDEDLDSFNLLDAAYGSDDAFDVQVPNIEYATRRSL